MIPIQKVKLNSDDLDKIVAYKIDVWGGLFFIAWFVSIFLWYFFYKENYYWGGGITVVFAIILIRFYIRFNELRTDKKNGIKLQGEGKIVKKIIETGSESQDSYLIEICNSESLKIDLCKFAITFQTFQTLSEGDILDIEYLPISKQILKLTKNGISIVEES